MPLNRTPGTEGNLNPQQGISAFFVSKQTSATILQYQVRNELLDEAGGLPNCPLNSCVTAGGVSWRFCIPGIAQAMAFSAANLTHLDLNYGKTYEVELRMSRDDGHQYSTRLSPVEKVDSNGVRVDMKFLDPEEGAALTGWIALVTKEASQPVGHLYSLGTSICRSLFDLSIPASEEERHSTGNVEWDRKLEALVTGTWHTRGGSIAATGTKRARNYCFVYIKGQQRTLNFSPSLHVPTPCDIWLKVNGQGISVAIKAASDNGATPLEDQDWTLTDWTSSEAAKDLIMAAASYLGEEARRFLTAEQEKLQKLVAGTFEGSNSLLLCNKQTVVIDNGNLRSLETILRGNAGDFIYVAIPVLGV